MALSKAIEFKCIEEDRGKVFTNVSNRLRLEKGHFLSFLLQCICACWPVFCQSACVYLCMPVCLCLPFCLSTFICLS